MTGYSPKIRFVLDGKILEIDFNEGRYSPTLTVLNYLRSLPCHRGVKEGCGVGDCGACTVVLGELAGDDSISYKAVNSCLLYLPMLQGKQLITVENVAGEHELHPVQQAMLEENASQCGYCTPGIVMSMFALYKNQHQPSLKTASDALTGNLCRCTGYQPILDAAMKACTNNGFDHFSASEADTVQLLKQIRSDDPPGIEGVTSYFRPSSLEDALDLKTMFHKTIFIDGFTDVALQQTGQAENLIDLSGISDLKTFSKDEQYLYFGAGLTIEEVRAHTEDHLPAISKILEVFGSLQIRNRATLGGNICSASPISDVLPVLFSSEATVELLSKKGKRELPVGKFIKSYRETGIRPDEILTGVRIPVPGENTIHWSSKISNRQDLDIATVNAGFSFILGPDELVSQAILAFGGLAATTKRAIKTEKFLVNKKLDEETIRQASEILYHEFEPMSDVRSDSTSRRVLARNLLLKCYYETKLHE